MNAQAFVKPQWLIDAEAEGDRRFAAANLQAGKWYAIADDKADPLLLYKCDEIDGELYLAFGENCRAEEMDWVPARQVFCQSTVCVLQI